jgi:hypothetical protein
MARFQAMKKGPLFRRAFEVSLNRIYAAFNAARLSSEVAPAAATIRGRVSA